MPLGCRVEWGDSAVVIVLTGRLIQTELTRLTEALTQIAAANSSPRIWLDLAELEFLDQTALQFIAAQRQRWADAGGLLRVRQARPAVARDLRQNGLEDLLTEPSPDERTSGAANPGEPDAMGPLVLAVDDEELVLSVINDFLVHSGYRVLRARRAAEALELYRQHGSQIDLVLIDLSLPDMSGMELIEALHTLAPEVHTILASGHGIEELGQHAGHPSIRAILQKPFSGHQLVEAVKNALSH